MNKFDGQSIVVVGGASGIGEATVRALIEQGCGVVIADLGVDQGLALATELGERALFHKTDATREEDVSAAIALAETSFGPLTGMVNSAGIIGAIGPIAETSVESFDRSMAILSRAVFIGVKHAAKAMKVNGKGSIVSLASTAGVMGGQGPHIYSMAKHGVIGLSKSAASELSSSGIRINVVAPGGTVTPLTAALTGGDNDLITEAIKADSPLGIACMPEDVANGILYLLSEDARYVTGHTLVIDAGVTTSGLATDFHSREPSLI